MYNLFLDDERQPPDDGREWTVVRSYKEATELVRTKGFPAYMSLDHDLGSNATGYDFVKFIVEYHIENKLKCPIEFYVHSQNPVGKENMKCYIKSYVDMMETIRIINKK